MVGNSLTRHPLDRSRPDCRLATVDCADIHITNDLGETTMKAFFAFACLFGATTAAAADEPRSFEDATVGELPKGWSSAKTGKGPGSVWKVVEDKTAPKGPKAL